MTFGPFFSYQADESEQQEDLLAAQARLRGAERTIESMTKELEQVRAGNKALNDFRDWAKNRNDDLSFHNSALKVTVRDLESLVSAFEDIVGAVRDVLARPGGYNEAIKQKVQDIERIVG